MYILTITYNLLVSFQKTSMNAEECTFKDTFHNSDALSYTVYYREVMKGDRLRAWYIAMNLDGTMRRGNRAKQNNFMANFLPWCEKAATSTFVNPSTVETDADPLTVSPDVNMKCPSGREGRQCRKAKKCPAGRKGRRCRKPCPNRGLKGQLCRKHCPSGEEGRQCRKQKTKMLQRLENRNKKKHRQRHRKEEDRDQCGDRISRRKRTSDASVEFLTATTDISQKECNRRLPRYYKWCRRILKRRILADLQTIAKYNCRCVEFQKSCRYQNEHSQTHTTSVAPSLLPAT
jgi:hypothetical protein